MPGVILQMTIAYDTPVRGLSRRFGALCKETLTETAAFWQREIFPKHFGPRNRSEYHYEQRNQFYLDVIKKAKGEGEGRFRDEVLSGKSQNWMRFLFKITGTAKKAVVRMNPPGYFTNPFIGSFTDPRTGKQKTITRQPDKPDEVTRVSEDDRRALELLSRTKLAEKIEASQSPPTTVQIP